MNNKQTIIAQGTTPIYLTNACCEDTGHGTHKVFLELGLASGYWDQSSGRMVDAPTEYSEWYPLTATEAKFIADDGFLSPEGYGMLGYSVLYKGQKWLFPSVEIGFRNDATRKNYGTVGGKVEVEEDMPSREEATKRADMLIFKWASQISAVGGSTYVQYDDGEADRHTVSLLVPFSHAKKMKTLAAYKKWLESLGK